MIDKFCPMELNVLNNHSCLKLPNKISETATIEDLQIDIFIFFSSVVILLNQWQSSEVAGYSSRKYF